MGAMSLETGLGELKVVTLDSLNIQRKPALIKIDVEGMELDVLLGGERLISESRPLIYVECLNQTEFRSVFNWLSERGYIYWDTFNASPTHLFLPLEKTTEDQRISRLHYKEVFEAYRTSGQLVHLRRQIDEINQKYRLVSEQITTYKQRTAKEEAIRIAAEEKLQQIAAQFKQAQERLEEANKKYRDATEQVSSLKQRVVQEEAARTESAKALEQIQAQLTEAQAKLQQERSGLQQQIEQLQAQGQSRTTALHEAEKQLIGLQAKFEANQERLEEANKKYRDATEQVSSLKQRVVQVEAARAESAKALEQIQAQLTEAHAKLQQERSGLQQQIEQLQAQGQSRTTALHEAEKQLIGLQAKFEANQERLEEANKKYRDATEQVSSLKQRVVQEVVARAESVKALEQIQAQFTQAQVQLKQERIVLQQQIEQLQAQASQLDAVSHELESANQKYRFATEQVDKLKQQLFQQENARLAAEKRVKQTAVQLEQANLKYRKITAEDVPSLKSKLEENYALKREQQHAIEQLKLDARKSKQALSEAHAKLQKLQQQKMAADQQVIKTRASLSFQLGYLLIENFKSVRGIISLPGALWAWRKELLKRRAQQNQRQKALEVVVPAKPVKVAVNQKPAAPERQQPIVLQSVSALTQNAPDASVSATALVKDPHHVKVACIMDEFTFGSYQPECTTQQLTPDHWEAELAAFQPELLFIESAWRGKDELWGSKVGHTSTELQGIVAWCRAKNVPTVFWNKEDPVHFETFLTTAKLFDHVFTTDIDCIHRYKAALGHERVYLLPFACQPANNNPIETYDRKDAFCFAGAYYAKYPERTRDLGNFVETLPAFRPLEIYDRNFGKSDPNYQFPAEYQPYIVGTLPFDQIDKAYKGYRYAINLNSIKQSQTMFARRVFELLASNTITVSNFSRGVRLLFGDLVITTDSGSEMVRHLNKVANDDVHGRKLRLAALRKVMQEHTYAQRMAYVVSKATGQGAPNTLPHIAVIALATTQAELDSILVHYQQQRHTHRSLLVVVSNGLESLQPMATPGIRFVPAAEVNGQTLRTAVGEVQWVATMVPQDYYGPNYLLDIALATRYSGADMIGKVAHFTWIDGATALQQSDAAYRPANSLPARCAATRIQTLADVPLAEWLSGLSERQLTTDNGLAIDEFNYCCEGAEPALREQVTASVDDLPALNIGIGIDELLMRAERIAPATTGHDESPVFTGKQLASNFGKAPSAAIQLGVEYDHWRIDSGLPDGKHEYLYATTEHSLEALCIDNQFKFYLDVTLGLNIQLVVVFLDAQKQKISHAIKHPNRNQQVDVPVGTSSIRFGLRFYAGGSAEIKGLVLGHRSLQPSEMIGQAEHLVLTNHYPSYEDLYRNGFVHSRVRAYRERGVRCDVFRLRAEEAVSYHEFEDVDVTTGSQEVLHKMLCSGQYKSVLVHFLDPAMWEVLQHHVDRIKVVVWVHGAEIQPWHRRDFNNETEEQRTVAKMKSDKRMAFWRELLKDIPTNLKLVFVSKWFAENVMEDIGFRIPEDHYSIIHNPINTDLFSYEKKPVEQRKKILSIRPYASKIYANDLSVKAILELSKKSFFNDFEFRIIGDGPLFEETLAPLRKFSNVYIEQRFLKQSEIASLHKEYGVFLCPSRMDTQGVSRDEAMSSGLVPITNVVAAIPEFVENHCGILAPGENAEAIAQGIAMLYEKPEQFATMSKAAAKRVRQQSDVRNIIQLELSNFSL
ncbi:glycosyl transferase family 1 [Comamonas aquatica DA1877]|uniref:Glycosyl transferase family 1 n=2 Tax=Comamonas aquatica TaxID=225991 RepID=A0A014NKP3_9BURK|nr:glycosyl transferase family 1 [Comamonas aquatica DA1877]